MSVFQHPHLTRGIVQTAKGAFAVSRGRVEMPDDIGESLGWRPLDGQGGGVDDERVPDVEGARSRPAARATAATILSPTA